MNLNSFSYALTSNWCTIHVCNSVWQVKIQFTEVAMTDTSVSSRHSSVSNSTDWLNCWHTITWYGFVENKTQWQSIPFPCLYSHSHSHDTFNGNPISMGIPYDPRESSIVPIPIHISNSMYNSYGPLWISYSRGTWLQYVYKVIFCP